jgi:hypothetical protein
MNGAGPEGKGSTTGRGMGKCKKNTEEEALQKLGKGLGKRRKTGGGPGKGKRLKNNQQ